MATQSNTGVINMHIMPHELVWNEIYFPPLLLVIAISYLFTLLIAVGVTKFCLNKYIAYPAVAEISIIIIFVGIISRFIPIF